MFPLQSEEKKHKEKPKQGKQAVRVWSSLPGYSAAQKILPIVFFVMHVVFLKTKRMYCFVNDTRYSIKVGMAYVFSLSFSFLVLFFLTNQLHDGNTVALVTQMSSYLSVKGLGTAQVDCEVRFQCLTGSPYSMGTTHH